MEGPVTPFVPLHEFSPEPDIVTEDQHTDSPVRKRARHTGSISNTASESRQSPVMVLEESKAPVRDDAYYMADGSCILRVQNTLFKV